MENFTKRTDLSDRDVALIHGGENLKYVVLSNNDNPITHKQWREMLELLESKEYRWCDGTKPTIGKVPPSTERNLWVREDKTLSFAQTGYFMRDFFIKLDDLIEIIKNESTN